ncbi:hypothetical protein LJC10_00950 [Selenomonadales bacterium OttesenSCG-928-I06]|nr:hypothetical protein [Selenomonadales bacterium OttesenSCG-928-I06]
MKKIVLLLIFLFVFAMPASAEIFKMVASKNIIIYSQHGQVIEKKNDASYIVFIEFAKSPGALIKSFSVKHAYISIYTRTTDYVSHKNFNPLIVFSLQNPPKFEITKNNLTETFVIPKKDTDLASHQIRHYLNSKNNATFGTAEKISVLLPLSDGTEMRIDLPEEIIEEWNYVYNADMSKEKKEMLNK